MKFRLLDDQNDDLKEFYSIQILNPSPYENLKVVHRRAYHRTCMMRASRMQDSISSMK